MWYICPVEYSSATKKNDCRLQQHGWTSRFLLIVSEVRQKWKDEYYIGITYVCDLEIMQISLQNNHKHRKQHMVTKEGNDEGRNSLFGINRYGHI